MPDFVLSALIGALATMSQLVLATLGLAVIFGLMRVINFAQGEFLTMGGFTVLLLVRNGVNVWLAILAAPLVVGGIGLGLERLIIRRFYGRPVGSLLVTFGLSLVLSQLMIDLFGTTPAGMKSVLGSVAIGRYRIEQYRIVLIVATMATLAVTLWLFRKTTYGLQSRAAVTVPDAAVTLGVNPARVNMWTFAMGSALAGLGGALLAPLIAVEPFMGQRYLARAFLTVVVGGPAAITGTASASGLLGLVDYGVTMATEPLLGQSAVLLVAVLVVRFLPNGLSRTGRGGI